MQKIISIGVIALAMSPLTAFAAESAGTHAAGGGHEGSEFFYQAAGGSQDITGSFAYGQAEVDFDNPASTDDDVDLVGVAVEYEYGLTDEYSIGAELGYEKQEYDKNKIKYTGLSDLEIFFKGHALNGALRYGAVLEYALEDSETKANGDGNVATGGAKIQPYIGYQIKVPTGYLGAKLARDIELKKEEATDKSQTPTEKTETEGGEDTVFAFFYEHHLASGTKIGASLTLTSEEDETETDTATNVETETKGLDTTDVTIYAAIPAGPGEFLPSFEHSMVDGAGGEITSDTIYLSYRLPF